MADKKILSYTYGAGSIAESPISLEELTLLKEAVLFTEDDEKYFRMAGEVLEDQIEEVLGLWYGFVG